MDDGCFDVVSTEETIEIEGQVVEPLDQIADLRYEIESQMKKLVRLEQVRDHLEKSYESRLRSFDSTRPCLRHWRPSEVVVGSRIADTAMGKADRIWEALYEYYQGPLSIMEGVNEEGLNIEILEVLDVRRRVLDSELILVFPRLLWGWPPKFVGTGLSEFVRNYFERREGRSKERLFSMIFFLVLFVMETEAHAGAYHTLEYRLEAVANQMPLISKVVSLLEEADDRSGELTNLRRITRNTLQAYSSMTFLEIEVSELLELLIERMEHLDIALRDIPPPTEDDCTTLQLAWGVDMILRCEETVQSIYEQMWSVFGPCLVEWESGFARQIALAI